MNPAAVIDWQSALAVLVVGLAAGSHPLVEDAPGGGDAAGGAALEQRDLEARRDALLQQLRELDDTASKRTPEQLARERYALELGGGLGDAGPRAARAGDRQRRVRRRSTPAAAVATAAPSQPSAMRGFLWGTATASAVGLLLFFVSRASTPREEGGSLTGTVGRLSSSETAGRAGGRRPTTSRRGSSRPAITSRSRT